MATRRTSNRDVGADPVVARPVWLLFGSVALVAAIAAGARADDHPRPIALTASAAPSPTSTSAAAGPTTTIASQASASAPAPSKAFCDGLRASLDRIQRISISLTDPASLRPLLDTETTAITQLSALATPRTASDIDAVKKVIGHLKSGMDAAGYEFSKLPPASALEMLSPDLMGAVGRLGALVQGAC